LTLKFVPRIRFAADTSFEYSSRIDAVLHQPEVERDLDDRAQADHGEGEGDHGP
jgi:ribosome-binding factor A